MSRALLLLLAGSFALTCANVACPGRPQAIEDPAQFSAIKFDYLVIGGGTAGVALSARLSENPLLVVGLIEAGTTHFGNPIIDAPANSPGGNPEFDWMFASVPQVHANGQIIALPRGKLLGGSSGINGLAWGRGSSAEYDAWNSFAPGHGWTWDGLLPYMKKAEKFDTNPPNPYPGITPAAAHKAQEDLPRVDGFLGPVSASHTSFYFDTVPNLVESLNALGIPTNAEPQSGNATGVTNTLLSVDPRCGSRSYSATTYFCSHSQNSNYRVLLNAQATRVLFSRTQSGLTATGVEYISGNHTYTANATREIILSAGADQTPQLLELSGVGNSTILQAYGIEPLIDLPGVGENWQDQVLSVVQFELKPGIATFDLLRNNATFAAEQAALYNETHTGLLAAADNTLTFVPLAQLVNATRLATLLDILDQGVARGLKTGVQQLQTPFLRQWLSQDIIGSVELIGWSKGIVSPESGKSYVTMINVLLHPLSRGNVHINSSDPLAPPAIDPCFLAEEFDLQALVDIIKFAQGIGRTEPFADLVATQTNPALSAQTDDDLIAYIRAGVGGADHHIGTAAMAPQDKGGVVDGTLKVYGTTNLRVVDASVIPNQIGAHTQASVYAIAEKVADMILCELVL